MKIYIFCLTLFLSLSGSGQEWELFPYKQKSFYSTLSYTGDLAVDLQVMDSIIPTTSDTILYFRKNFDLHGAGTCYEDTLKFIDWSQNFSRIDSLIYNNDTIFYYFNVSTTPFFFLPKAGIGESWEITSTYSYNRYTKITITCVAKEEITFLGLTDSVKTYTLKGHGGYGSDTPIDSFRIKLSKSYGLIEYVPFHLFLFNDPAYNSFFSFKLIGIEKNGNSYGYRQPEFEDYFHLNVGDILAWRRYNDPSNVMYPSWTEYYRDSITHVFLSSDSVIYTYDRTIKDKNNNFSSASGLQITYRKIEFENIISTPPDWIGFGDNQFGTQFNANSVNYWFSDFLNININDDGDTTTSYSFYNEGYSIDTVNCQLQQVTDIAMTFGVNTIVGVYQYCQYFWGSDCVSLIGYRINGKEAGDLGMYINNLPTANKNLLNIYPNPASNVLFIEHLSSPSMAKDLEYILYNGMGQQVMNGKTNNKYIDISDLEKGFYFIQLKIENQISLKKFVKQ